MGAAKRGADEENARQLIVTTVAQLVNGMD
jgi:hypothetical protein